MVEQVQTVRRGAPLELTGPTVPIGLSGAASRFSLRVRGGDVATIGAVAGVRLDVPVNRWTGGHGHFAARLGPDEWLLVSEERNSKKIADAIDRALAGRSYSMVDISHRQVAFDVSGPNAGLILASGCPLDLHALGSPENFVTRTLLGKAEIVLFRIGTSTYRVECWRSFASYVHGFLREAARDSSAGV